MTTAPRTKRRVVIVDDSRTMQAMLENAFGGRPDFEVVGVAGDAKSGAEMIKLLRPDIATIDLCMPYIDGAALLKMISEVRGTCAITVSDQSARNVAVTAELQKLGAVACLSKVELARDPKSFFKKVNEAYDTFDAARKHRIASFRTMPTSGERTPASVLPNLPRPSFPVPLDERRRLDILGRTQLANAVRERQFDAVTRHFAAATDFPVCLITFIDKDTQWIKSGVGLTALSTPREQAFCNYTISQGGAFVVEDATTDSRFSTNPLVIGPPRIRSYAGHSIEARDGTRIGALCLIDIKPRKVSSAVLRQLAGMAEIVSEMIAQRPVPGSAEQLIA